MGGYGDVKLLREDGKRLDGRAIDEMRPVTIEAGVLLLLMVRPWLHMD